MIDFDFLNFGVLIPLSAIFQLYHGDQFIVVEEAGVPGENHDHVQATAKLYHLRLRVECQKLLNNLVIYKVVNVTGACPSPSVLPTMNCGQASIYNLTAAPRKGHYISRFGRT
jgi:hypothetical protein